MTEFQQQLIKWLGYIELDLGLLIIILIIISIILFRINHNMKKEK